MQTLSERNGLGYNSFGDPTGPSDAYEVSGYQSSMPTSSGNSAGSELTSDGIYTPQYSPSSHQNVVGAPQTLDDLVARKWQPGGHLFELCAYLQSQEWFILNKMEPEMSDEELSLQGTRRRTSLSSRFEEFFTGGPIYSCLFQANGNQTCGKSTTSKDVARGHARQHLGYKPFGCRAACGNKSW